MIDLAILQKICDDLKGQCTEDLREVCERHGIDSDDLELADHHYIDNAVFECERCGWWCDISELSAHEDFAGMVCSDHDDEDGDE